MDHVTIISLVCGIFFGAISNTFALVFIFKKKSKLTLKDIGVAVLCCSNLVQQCVGFTIELYSNIRGYIGDVQCQMTAFTVCTTTYIAIGCFFLLMVDRYVSIVFPFKYFACLSTKHVKKVVPVIPILYGMFFGCAPLIGWGAYGRSRLNSTYCGFDFTHNAKNGGKSFFFTTLCCTFAIPLSLSMICFIHILVDLKRTETKFARKLGKASIISQKCHKTVNDQYVSTVLTALIYLVSWAPFAVVCVMFYYQHHVSYTFEAVSTFMAKSAGYTSPVVYCIIEKGFWRYFKCANPSMVSVRTL